ncbi:hypothetical protein LI90_4352 (plasmid) [Carbonactinospora thermoautotrophica]|uniref:Uncharacterized protein n=1 Tax=Carbonactinospora thermoautotrophica TaxID=1469144 RepID=A0A132MHP3_9ACTN|nr:hypothetical protein [Carbonactinospora thermoautotrophica]KWW97380.1 hypothetical protein LI90_4352 [Carbonactinospora thermoautotrophica]
MNAKVYVNSREAIATHGPTEDFPVRVTVEIDRMAYLTPNLATVTERYVTDVVINVDDYADESHGRVVIPVEYLPWLIAQLEAAAYLIGQERRSVSGVSGPDKTAKLAPAQEVNQ